MRNLQRLAAAGAMAALAVAVAACGGPAPIAGAPTTAPATSVAPSPGPQANGVTQPTDVFGPACNELPQAGEPGSAVRVAALPAFAAIAANPLLKTMTTALQKAGLVDTLNQGKEITVFAVYDRGFANFQQNLGDRFNQLMGDQNALADVLKYQVIVKRYDRAGLVSAGTVTTLQGGSLRIRDDRDTMNITDNTGTTAHVLCGNIPTANATLFLIDNVLQPKNP
ncbi:MAG TPA: fasciclin domain-containing protein [Pseudonocardia sp.]|nr:fasciclin domain-containing protein [Pseudonocardia sp.]